VAASTDPDVTSAMERFCASALTHLLVVSDAQASRDWYVHALDASVYGEYGGTSVVLNLLGNWLLLVTGGGPTADKPDVTFAPPGDDPDGLAGRVSSELIFRVDDCRATYELLRSRGVTFLAEPVDWGAEVRAFFRDPDGHLFEISQLTGSR
jgi:catechol 2,3-dioxygenase-like lactoylglutathione lyase family enzyme